MLASQKPHSEEGVTGRISCSCSAQVFLDKTVAQEAEQSLEESHQGPSFKGCCLDHTLG